MSRTERLFLAALTISSIALSIDASPAGDGDSLLRAEQASPVEEHRPLFGSTVEVTIVNTLVTVVDRKGRPVAGLGINDFEVFEDGAAMRITNLEEVRGSRRATSRNREGALQKSGTLQSAFMVIAFDNPSLEQRSRRKFTKHLSRQFQTGPPHGLNVLVAVIGERLKIIEPFTVEPERLLDALTQVDETTPLGSYAVQRRRILNRDILRTGNVDSLIRIRIEREQERLRINRTLEATAELSRRLAGLPGKKDLLLVTQNIAMAPALDTYEILYKRVAGEDLDPPGYWAEELSMRKQLETLADLMHAAGVSLHVIDTSDRDRQLATAEFGSALKAWHVAPSSADGGEYVADLTGGTSFGNSRNYSRFLERLWPQVTDYYSLGYVRPSAVDGRLHDIKVIAADEDYTARYNAKALAETIAQRLQRLASASMGLWPNDSGSDLELDVARLERWNEAEILLVLSLSFPAQEVLFREKTGERTASIFFGLQTLDDAGTALHFVLHRESVPAIDHADSLAIQLRLRIDSDTRRLVVVVRDELGGYEVVGSLTFGSFAHLASPSRPHSDTGESGREIPKVGSCASTHR